MTCLGLVGCHILCGSDLIQLGLITSGYEILEAHARRANERRAIRIERPPRCDYSNRQSRMGIHGPESLRMSLGKEENLPDMDNFQSVLDFLRKILDILAI